MTSSTTKAQPVTAAHGNETVEKFNAAEMGGPAFDHKRGKNKRKNRNHGEATVKRDSDETKVIRPTPERLAKGDLIAGEMVGTHRSQPPIERLRGKKAPDGFFFLSDAEYAAALKLAEIFQECGLSASVQAQDLNRVIASDGSGGVPYGMANGERAAHCRKEFRLACKLMGWHAAHPFRGAGRLVVDVVCYEVGLTEAGQTHLGGGRKGDMLSAAADRLREGLFALAIHWRLC